MLLLLNCKLWSRTEVYRVPRQKYCHLNLSELFGQVFGYQVTFQILPEGYVST